jgi:hypothetical protein
MIHSRQGSPGTVEADEMTPQEEDRIRQGADAHLLRQELGHLERSTVGVATSVQALSQVVHSLLAALGQPTEADPRTVRDLLVELLDRLAEQDARIRETAGREGPHG